jgi:hypothetical protein
MVKKHKKIISYSLYGKKPQYLEGAIKNAEQIKIIYPEWVARFYVGEMVPDEIIRRLRDLDAEIYVVEGREDASAMFWRFRAFCDNNVNYVMIRDADSRLTKREKNAVDEWMVSGANFHIMRDHPAHNCAILGGLWGVKCSAVRHLCPVIESVKPVGKYGEDQDFLCKYFYPLAKQSSVIHDSFFKREYWSRPFPNGREDKGFVGEVFDEYDKPRQSDRVAIDRAMQNYFYRLRLRVSGQIKRLADYICA